ncbi:MAG: hypothetical protein ABIM50_02710 [Novosphingobium sp.]
MMDVWKAAAPSLAFLSPDIYVDDFAGTLTDFQRPENPMFVPEARPLTGNLVYAILERERIARLSGSDIADVRSTLSFLASMIADRLRSPSSRTEE